jgi:5-oxoprolinase (ATP-hydrolysing)
MTPSTSNRWSFWIDRGGTFTDIVAIDANGRLRTLKLLSVAPQAYRDPAVEGIRRLLGVDSGAPLPQERIAAVHLGTTVATNALLERKGARLALITTRGFRDQLRIGNQTRPKLFVRKIVLPEPLYEHVIEVDERISARGEVILAIDVGAARMAMREAVALGFDTAAIVFMHGYRYPAHEQAAAIAAREAGFTHVSASHEVSPLMKFVPRGGTTLADAYLTPVLRAYIDELAKELGPVAHDGRLRFMRSDGGLSSAGVFRARDAILSGPAGGVVGMAKTAKAAGFARVIGFDMGGTSTDVSRYDGTFEHVAETEVAGVRLRVPMLAIHTVAAGGGSILSLDAGRMRVGPQSAGAVPGPACYRHGGPLTVTDANVMTGRIQPNLFPAIFGPSGNLSLDGEIVRRKFAALSKQRGTTPEALADGFLEIAVANMAEAIKRISVQKGYDVREYALNAFGGAAGQLAARVAGALGMREVMIHPLASLLSAYGIGLADLRATRALAVDAALDQAVIARLQHNIAALLADVKAELIAQGVDENRIETRVTAHICYAGSDTSLPVPFASLDIMAANFTRAHKQLFGFWSEAQSLILESIAVEATGTAQDSSPDVSLHTSQRGVIPSMAKLYIKGQWRDANVHWAGELSANARVDGPALIAEPNSMIVVEPGWTATMREGRVLVLAKETAIARTARRSTAREPVMLEIANARFMSIAEQMGATLEKTASSVNIKERLDFSCAIFNASGELIANAPHMPVHLGSMGDSVTAIVARHGVAMKAGDAFALNNPYDGGTHLPDVTVVMPVYAPDGGLIAFTAARGHHADIGGKTPGSMPPDSTTLAQEGVLIDGIRIVHEGGFAEGDIRKALGQEPFPSRDPDRNIADLKAQIASCGKGAQELTALCDEWGADVVKAYMGHALDDAEAQTRAVISKLKDGKFKLEMDDGAIVQLAISVDREKKTAVIDFAGTSAQRNSNFNAPRPVTQAAVLYAFRCLVDSDMPLNAGCLRPLTIKVPAHSMLNPRAPAAVVAGNVETSQAVTDAMFAAMGVMAAAQGTMNNLTFGNAQHQYYETICGGAGAGPDFDGASAVHTHMTNSRMTDPEVLEWRFPVRVRRFEIRRGSGGKGRRTGGDGVIRELEFLEPMDVSILSTRRRTSPFGLEGGGDAAKGRTLVKRASGGIEELKSCDSRAMAKGDVIIVETPGGGGFGKEDV